MQKRFAQKIEEMRRLIDGSASVSMGPGGSQGDRKRATPLIAGGGAHEVGGVLSVPLASPCTQYLLAVSGGMDSMCMADLFLQTLGAESFAIAHCNFYLRGEESDGDEALVREWAERNGIRLFVKRFDTVAYAREKGISIEMAARDLRYGWFAELCREHGFAALSVAHNANDNAETLLLNLLRGTGLNGLHGMAEISEMCAIGEVPEDGEDMPPPARGCLSVAKAGVFGISGTSPVVVCRPLLEFTRKQIEGYVFVRRVPYRHDSSNFSSDYKRNKIRNEVFPVFEKINPSFIRTLNREIGYFAEAGSIVEDWCKAHVADVITVVESAGKEFYSFPTDRHLNIDTAALFATPHWRYLLYYILEPCGFSSQTLASIESLLTSDRTIPGKRFESPTHVLMTGRKVLTVMPLRESYSMKLEESRSAVSERSISLCSCSASHSGTAMLQGANAGPCLPDDITVVRGTGTYSFNGIRFTVEVLPWTPDMQLKQPQGTLIMDADKMPFPFVCRRWRQGDWLVPLGMKGKKKVSDLFTDLKYDTPAKEAAIIMVDVQTSDLAEQQHVAGLLGLRIDDRYKVTPATKSVIRISTCDA